MDFLDELSGVGFVGAPEIQVAYGLSYAQAALVLFVLPQLAGLLLEPPLFLLADRFPRKPFVVLGLTALAAGQVLAGLSWSPWVLALALAVAHPASGVGVNVAQACLMDARPRERERMMARWAFMGSLGDLATPALFALLAVFGLGWRTAFLVTGAALFAYAALLGLPSFPRREAPEGDKAAALGSALRTALSHARLLRWLGGVLLCSLLDEVLVAFAALRLDRLGASAVERSLVLMGFVGGSLVGLVLTERLLRRIEPLRLLRHAGVAGAVSYLAWLAAPGLLASGLLLTVVGACAAPLYPIAQAQAYRALPDRSGAVNAAAALFRPIEIALPLVLGVLADQAGLVAALAVLGLQPVGLAALAVIEERRSAQGRPCRARGLASPGRGE